MANIFEQKPWLKNYPDYAPKEIDWPKIPIWQILKDAAKDYPLKTALVFMGKELNYKEIDRLSDSFAFYLKKNGFKKGDKLALLLPNCPQYIIAFWGGLKAGGIITAMNPLYSERELGDMLDDSEAKTIVVLDGLYPKLKNIQSQTKITKVILTSIADYFPTPLKIAFALKNLPKKLSQKKAKGEGISWFKESVKTSADFQPMTIDPEKDLAVLQYTGGTTGKPKGVMLTHKNLVVNTIQLKYWFPMEKGEETIVGVIPFFHIGGTTVSLTWGTLWAAKLVIIPRFHTKPTLKAISQYQATAFVAVPAIYIALDKAMDKAKGKYSIASLKLTGGGMAPFPKDLFETYKNKYGKRLVEGYGLTENAGVTFQNLNENSAEYRAGSIGFPFPGTEVKIVNPETNETVDVNQPGELCLKGPHISIGYFNRPEENQKAFKDNWFYTGDMAQMDNDGYFYILGRKDDVIGVKGFKIYPREIENVLESSPLVSEAAVIGIPDYYAGEKIIAYVIPEEGEKPNEEELMALCRQNLVDYKIPMAIKIKDNLPRSAARKILKYVLKQEAIKDFSEKNSV